MRYLLLIALAILLSVAVLAPVLILTFWRRATSIDATVTLLVGLLAAEALIRIDPSPANFSSFAFNGLCAGGLGLLGGILTSSFRRAVPEEGNFFMQAILNDSEDSLHLDRGV